MFDYENFDANNASHLSLLNNNLSDEAVKNNLTFTDKEDYLNKSKIINLNDNPIGMIFEFHYNPECVELAYFIDRNSRGKKYSLTALKQYIEELEKAGEYDYISLIVKRNNIPSLIIAGELGFSISSEDSENILYKKNLERYYHK